MLTEARNEIIPWVRSTFSLTDRCVIVIFDSCRLEHMNARHLDKGLWTQCKRGISEYVAVVGITNAAEILHLAARTFANITRICVYCHLLKRLKTPRGQIC